MGRDLCAQNISERVLSEGSEAGSDLADLAGFAGAELAEACSTKGLRLLTATDGIALPGQAPPPRVDYLFALLPRGDVELAQARFQLRLAVSSGTDTDVRAAIRAWNKAKAANEREAATVASMAKERAADGERERWLYDALFLGPNGECCGYAGHETTMARAPRGGHTGHREKDHIEGKGASWTARAFELTSGNFTHHQPFIGTKHVAVVAELVSLMESVIRDGASRAWRGGPFMSTCPITAWDGCAVRLWEALCRVRAWPASYEARVQILDGIVHLVPGNRLWYYLENVCFACGGRHFAGQCSAAQGGAEKGGGGAGKKGGAGAGTKRSRKERRSPSPSSASSSASSSSSEEEEEVEVQHTLLQGDTATSVERSQATIELSKQGLSPPLGFGMRMPAGCAIALSSIKGGGKRDGGHAGRDFGLHCVLARALCIKTGGAPNDVIIYEYGKGRRTAGKARALLSSKGMAALTFVSKQPVAALRRASKDADPTTPPARLIRRMLKRWIKSELEVPVEFGEHSAEVIAAWWAMHIAGVAALGDSDKLKAWNEVSARFREAILQASYQGAGAAAAVQA